MKIILEGAEGETTTAAEMLRDVFAVASVSKFYPSRDDETKGRVYVNLLEPKGGHVNDFS